MLSAPLWVWVIRRTSKRAGWLLGSAAAAALPSAVALSMTSHAVCFWAVLPDTVE